ncbi:MAG: hypothetical protein PVI90_17215, partial [Desulfobacteraceae bacterium]
MKKIFKWVLFAAVVLLLLVDLSVIGFVHYINSSNGKDWLVNRINTVIAGTITVADYHFAPLNGSFDLNGVTLKDPEGMDVFEFEKFYLKLNWRSLLKKEIRISEVRLRKPLGRLYVDNADRLNLVEAVTPVSKKPKSEEKNNIFRSLPLNIVVEYLTIVKGNISYDYPKQAMSIHATGMNLWADGDFASQQANLKIELADLNFKSTEMQLPSTNLAMIIGLNHSKVDLQYLTLAMGQSNLELNGDISEIYELSGLDLQLHSEINLSEISQIFRLSHTLQGRTVVDANFKGKVENPNIDLKVELVNGSIYNRVFDQIVLSATLLDRQLAINKILAKLGQGRMNLTGKADLKSAFANGFLKPPTNLDDISFDIALEQKADNLGAWVPEVPGLKGTLESYLTLSGQGASKAGLKALLNLQVKGKNLIASGVHRPLEGHFGLNAEINGQAFHLKQLDGNIDGTKINGTGSYQPKARTAIAQLVLDAKDLSQPLTLFGLPTAKGSLQLSFDLSGTLDLPRVGLVIDSKNLGYGDINIGTVQLAADLSPNRVLQISSLKLANQGSSVKGQAKIRFLEDWKGIDPKYDQSLQLNLKTLEVRDFYHQEIIRGNIDGQLKLSGILEDLKGTLGLNAHDLTLESIALGDLDTLVHLNGNLLELKYLQLKNKNSELNGSGRISLLDNTFGKLVEDPQFQLLLSSNNINLEDFFDGYSGAFSIDTKLKGSIKHPTGSIALHGTKFESAVQKIDVIDLSARLKNDQISIDPLKIALKGEDTMTFKGWAKKDHSFAFDLHSNGINLSSIDKLTEVDGVKGVLNTKISGYGTLDDPAIDGTLLLDEIFVNDQPVKKFKIQFGLHNHLVKAYGNLNFDVDASYHLLSKEFSAKLAFYETKLNTYLRIAGLPDMGGTIGGQVNIRGNADELIDTVADLNLNELSLFLKEDALVQTKQLKARMTNQHITLE